MGSEMDWDKLSPYFLKCASRIFNGTQSMLDTFTWDTRTADDSSQQQTKRRKKTEPPQPNCEQSPQNNDTGIQIVPLIMQVI